MYGQISATSGTAGATLAATGLQTGGWVLLAFGLMTVGVALVTFARMIKARKGARP